MKVYILAILLTVQLIAFNKAERKILLQLFLLQMLQTEWIYKKKKYFIWKFT